MFYFFTLPTRSRFDVGNSVVEFLYEIAGNSAAVNVVEESLNVGVDVVERTFRAQKNFGSAIVECQRKVLVATLAESVKMSTLPEEVEDADKYDERIAEGRASIVFSRSG